MAFIGTPLDTRNTFQSLVGKRFSGDGSTTAFTLDVAPGSTLDIEVFVGNVRQDPNSAYTLSGTTLTFTGAPPSGTNNIYVVHQAKSVGTIGIPDDTISARTLVTADSSADHVIIEDATDGELKKALYPSGFSVSSITGATELAATPADTDEFIISDAGTLKRLDFSHIKSVAGTNAFLAFANGNTSVSDNTETKVAFDEEKYDVDSAYDHSTNYRFVAPADGKYFFYFQVYSSGQDNEQLRDTYGQFRVNGTAQSQTRELQNNNPSYLRMVNASAVLNLSASDYVEVYILIESVNNTQRYDGDTSQLRTFFGGFRLT